MQRGADHLDAYDLAALSSASYRRDPSEEFMNAGGDGPMNATDALKGRHVVILGGGSGMGLATAEIAREMGASLTLGGNDRRRLEEAARAIPDARLVDVDISSRQSVEAAFVGLPVIDHLVITAGSRINGKLADTDPDRLLDAVRERTFGSVYAVHAALPLLSPAASIVLMSGVLTQRPLAPGNAVFAASVGAVEALVRGLALELQPVRVNAVAPGVTDSTFFAETDEPTRSALFARASANNLVKRVGTVGEIAQAIIFLMTNAFMTGEILRIDGGARVA